MTHTAPEKFELGSLRKRSEFLHVRDGLYAARGALVVQMRAQLQPSSTVRVGFTATKKIGNAVTRNRAKRRLREIARALLPELGVPGHDYVFIARGNKPGETSGTATTARAWPDLLDDARKALITLSRRAHAQGGETSEQKTVKTR